MVKYNVFEFKIDGLSKSEVLNQIDELLDGIILSLKMPRDTKKNLLDSIKNTDPDFFDNTESREKTHAIKVRG